MYLVTLSKLDYSDTWSHAANIDVSDVDVYIAQILVVNMSYMACVLRES